MIEANPRPIDTDPVRVALNMAEAFREKDPLLAANFSTYALQHKRLLEKGEGTFVVIIDGEIVAEELPNREMAIEIGYGKTTGPMLIKEVLTEEIPPTIAWSKYQAARNEALKR